MGLRRYQRVIPRMPPALPWNKDEEPPTRAECLVDVLEDHERREGVLDHVPEEGAVEGRGRREACGVVDVTEDHAGDAALRRFGDFRLLVRYTDAHAPGRLDVANHTAASAAEVHECVACFEEPREVVGEMQDPLRTASVAELIACTGPKGRKIEGGGHR